MKTSPKSLGFPRLSACLVALLASSSAEGGNVFMKNGYIIQGPIVERSDDSVVLGWPNGKVTIHRRFIDNVAFDQIEEKRLKEDERHMQAQATPSPDDVAGLLETGVGDELLPDLNIDIDAVIKNQARAIQAGSQASVATNDPAGVNPLGGNPLSTTPSDGSSTATIVERPQDALGERVSCQPLAFSLRPPKGWTGSTAGSAFVAAGSPLADGFKPSINVLSVPKGDLSEDDYAKALKEENAHVLLGYEVLAEGPRTGAAAKGYEIVGKGSFKGRAAVLRQTIVTRGQTVWLLSAFTPVQGGDALLSATDESLKSFEPTDR